MYVNVDGKCSIVDRKRIESLLNERKILIGNVIYCKRLDSSYFFKKESFETEEELKLAVAKYSLEGFEVYYHVDIRTDKTRNTKRKR